jgi:putative FmdB family regulatory protein
MPLYEYQCRGCGNQFEALIRTGDVPACPTCKSGDLERILSLFGVATDQTRQSNLQSARKANAKVLKDKQVADHEMIHHHHH